MHPGPITVILSSAGPKRGVVLTHLDLWDSRSYDSCNPLAYLLAHGKDAATHTGDGDASMIIRPDGYGHMASFSALTCDKLHIMIWGNQAVLNVEARPRLPGMSRVAASGTSPSIPSDRTATTTSTAVLWTSLMASKD